MQDKCGVVGVKLHRKELASLPAYYALYALQHRGQEAAGIVTHDGFQQHVKKDLGRVSDVFSEEDLKDLVGRSAIGHIRYPTSGPVDNRTSHPFTVNTKRGSLALGHNGTLTGTEKLRDKLEEEGHMFTANSDTELMIHELAQNLLSRDIIPAIKQTMQQISGAYSVALLYNDMVIGIRDPRGIRPLCIGEIDGGYILASESVAIDVLGGELLRDVKPGEVVMLTEEGIESYQLYDEKPAHCFFEYVYFARPDSRIDGRVVYDVRRKLGGLLYENHGIETDIVSPVPDSGRSFASGYAQAGDLLFGESLMKNRYVGRTFIMPTQNQREIAVRLKLNPIESNIKGKSLTLVDDSIVRGTTSKQLVDILRKRGAEELHIRIGSPPISSPCYLGIDMATSQELIASDMTVDDIREELGADSLRYSDLDDISEAVDFPLDHLCTGCITGEYPISGLSSENRE